MARPRASFNAVVGRKRLAKSLGADVQSDTRSARAGMAQVIRNYRKFVQTVEESMPDVLYEALVPTFGKSQEYCPIDTGALRESGYLEITEFRRRPRVEIGYGVGGDPDYAAKVHENMEYRHKAPTRAKWLQVALEEDEEAIQMRIIQALRV
jgi:hypothetical protein